METRSPLTPEQRDQLAQRLRELRGRLEQELAGIRATLRRSQGDALGELSVYDNHPADIGDELFERSKDWALSGLLERRLARVDAALERLRRDSYGLCADCGRPIDPRRLEAMPEAERCRDCQEALERQQARQPEARPVEEEVLQGPYARLYGFGFPHRVGYDEEDAWQEVERYGTSDTPQDIPGTRGYDELIRNEDERVGVVQAVEGLIDETGEVIGDAPDELEAEALSDPRGDMALREGSSVRLAPPRHLRRRPPPR